jgi:putative transposase
MLWAWLSRSWHGWRSAVHIVKGNRHRVAPTRLSSLLDVERSTFGYLLHDRDAVFADVATTIAAMNIRAVRTAPRSTWQNGHVERVIGSIRRECLDHVIALSAAGLQRVLTEYTAYYMTARTHLALAKDSPTTRPIMPPSAGRVVATPLVGGLHHRYDRAAG